MSDSPLAEALQRIGDRWTLLVIDALLGGPRRFGELSGAVEGIAPNVLTARLRRLEADGVVVSRPYQERPVRHEYQLTEAGRDLADALTLLRTWGARHGAGAPTAFHRTCGAPLEARLWCPTCERPVEDPDADATVDV